MSNVSSTPIAAGARLLRVLSHLDLIVYGLVYVSPIGPWPTWGFARDLSGGAVALAYLLGAGALMFTAFSYAKMANAIPEGGSVYSYARSGMGEAAGFVAAWMVLLDYLLLPALIYVFCSIQFHELVPAIPAWGWTIAICGYNVGVNWFGVKTSAHFNLGTLFAQFALLFCVLATALFFMYKTGTPAFTVHPWWGPGVTATKVFAGASLGMMAYLGFDAITTLSSEVKPEQVHLIGRSVILSLAVLGTLAVLNVWILGDLSLGMSFDDPTTATHDVLASRIGPTFSGAVVILGLIITAISITPPMVTGVSRVLYTMATHGEMPRLLAVLHPKYGVPRAAIAVSGLISLIVALYFSAQFDTLTAMVNCGALVAFIAVNCSVVAYFVLKRGSRRWWSHLISPAIGVVVLTAVLANMRSLALLVGSVWMMAGIAVYAVLYGRSKNKSAPDLTHTP